MSRAKKCPGRCGAAAAAAAAATTGGARFDGGAEEEQETGTGRRQVRRVCVWGGEVSRVGQPAGERVPLLGGDPLRPLHDARSGHAHGDRVYVHVRVHVHVHVHVYVYVRVHVHVGAAAAAAGRVVVEDTDTGREEVRQGHHASETAREPAACVEPTGQGRGSSVARGARWLRPR